jgi:hypothetical protein
MRQVNFTQQAIRNIAPDAIYAIRGGLIEWHSPDHPSQAVIDKEAARLQAALPREAAHKQRREERTRAETNGFIFNGHLFDSDRDSILRIANAATTALTANLIGTPFATEWHCADGYDMPLDAAGVMAMQGALAAHGQACHDRSSALRAMIDAPEADLDALAEEIKTGWPGQA